MDFLGAAHGWGWSTNAPPAPLKMCHTYRAIMKLDTVIPCLKKIQKIHNSRDAATSFAKISIFPQKISSFCYIKKPRYRLYFNAQFLILLILFESLNVFFNKYDWDFDDISKIGYTSPS